MKKNIILLLAFTLLISFGCKKKYDIYTDSDTIYIDGVNGSTATVKVTANTNWVISSTAYKWLKISPSEGSADETVTFTCIENMSYSNLVAIVTIGDPKGNAVKQIKVMQKPFPYGDIKLVVATTDGIYYSVDGGYTLVKQALSGQFVGGLVKTTAGFFASADDGVYKSPDGYGWDKVRADSSVQCITADNNILYIGTSSGIFKSVDDGDTWTALSFTDYTKAIAVKGNIILAGTTTGVSYSTDGGSTWNSGTDLMNRNITFVGISNNNYYAGTTWSIVHGASGLWKSTDGISWTNIAPLSDNISSLMVTKKDTIYTGSGKTMPTSSDRGFYRSYDGGTTWSAMNLKGYNVTGFSKYGNYLFAGTNNYGLFVSMDDGNIWSKMNNTGITVNAVIASHL